MASPAQLSINRKTPLDSFDLAVAKRLHNGVDPALLKALQNLTPKSMSTSSPSSATPSVPPPPPSVSSQRAPNQCPCPNERKLLVETAASIACNLLEKFRVPKAESSEALTSSCVHCGGSRPCGPGCSCPCHGFFAPKSCAETFKREADKERGQFEAFPEPPDPETITDCKPQQLRAGKFLTLCDCTKRNGLQHLCRRWGCSEKCPRMRPKQRTFVLGDPVPVLDSTPKCCAGKMQAEMYRMMESKVDEMLKKSQNRRRCEDPIRPLELPPPPAFNWNGIFPHVCRQAGDECKRRPKPFPKIPGMQALGRAGPRPCTYPICRANCYEDPPPRPPKPDFTALALTTVPYLKQETC